MMDPELKADQGKWAALAMAMQTLQQYPEWDTYREQMEQAELRHVERLIVEKDDARFFQGIVTGLRLAYGLPQLLIEKSKKT